MMELEDIEELRDFNELDIIYKMEDLTTSIKKRVEQTVKDNKTAGIDVRKTMQDIKMLAEVMRNLIQIRHGYFDRENIITKSIPKSEIKYRGFLIDNNVLEKYIVDKKISYKKEDEKASKIENLRRQNK